MADDPYKPLRPWYRKPAFVLSAAFLALVVGGSLIVVLIGGNRGGTPDPTPTTTASTATSAEPTTSPGSSDPQESVCGLPAGDQSVPSAPPADATWELVGTVAVPNIDQVGPGETAADGMRYCFAHSPTGALLAAMNVPVMANLDPSFQADARIVADTPERDRVAAELETATPSGGGTTGVQFAGFLVEMRDENTANVTVVLQRANDGALFAYTAAMRWEDGDWKIVLPETGEVPSRQLDSLSGYVEWRGV